MSGVLHGVGAAANRRYSSAIAYNNTSGAGYTDSGSTGATGTITVAANTAVIVYVTHRINVGVIDPSDYVATLGGVPMTVLGYSHDGTNFARGVMFGLLPDGSSGSKTISVSYSSVAATNSIAFAAAAYTNVNSFGNVHTSLTSSVTVPGSTLGRYVVSGGGGGGGSATSFTGQTHRRYTGSGPTAAIGDSSGSSSNKTITVNGATGAIQSIAVVIF